MRDNRIDIIKGLAIISVIILHTLSPTCLTSIYRIFHINQAVPIFMLISGYVFTLSFKNKGITDLRSCYDFNILKKRLKRLYLPFLTVYFLEVLLYKVFLSEDINAFFILKNLIFGGFGPGSYYPVIIFQFLFVIPIIYVVSYKKLNYTIPIFFIIGILFELFTYTSGISEEVYRLSIGRYLFVISLGSYLALNQNKINRKLLYSSAILSAAYMYTSVYLNYHIFGHDFWIPHQAPAYFYTALLFIIGMGVLPEKAGPIFAMIANFGKASWHIFLIQMLYFWTIRLRSDSIFIIVVNLIVCIIIGYLFYWFENNIYCQKILKKTVEIN